MNKPPYDKFLARLPWVVAACAVAVFALWLVTKSGPDLARRIPGTDRPPEMSEGGMTNAVLAGKLVASGIQPAEMPGAWPQFRGPGRTGISPETNRLARAWGTAGPKELWSVDLGEGYAGPVVLNSRVYIMDYDQQNKQDTLRCLALADGKEIWRYSYPVSIKRSHGMSRTVPFVTEKFVVAIGPKCHALCLDALSGELRWGMDMVRQFGTVVPPWYTGQCPLLQNDQVILAPGGTNDPNALLVAVQADTGQVLWRTPNPREWKMTHGSVMPMEFGGRRIYVYCASAGVVGVSAEDGSILWENAEWKISIATVPSPVPLSDGRIFLTGGYDAGSVMLQLRDENGQLKTKTLFRLKPAVFGATQHTPVLYQDHLYGIRAQPEDQFVCLDLDGQVIWTSGSEHRFELGPFLVADGLIFAMNGSGKLSLLQATPEKFNLLAQAQVLKGRESWGPLALANGRLLARDLTRMVCLDVAHP